MMIWKIGNKTKRFHNSKKYLINWNKPAPSIGAQRVKDFLKKEMNVLGLDQWYEEYRLPGTKLFVDFLNLGRKVAIEYNDHSEHGHHSHFNKFFHKNRIGFLNSIKRDVKKAQILEDNGILLMEIYEEDLDNLETTLLNNIKY
jgi:hypothetical protein